MRATFPVSLRNVAASQSFPATLVQGVTLDEVDEAVALWSPFLASQQQRSCRLAEHSGWNWSRKARTIRGLNNYAILGIDADGEMQALMLWDDLHSEAKHPSQLGKDLVYVEFLSTAPWNDADVISTPRFRGAGTILLSAAVERSKDLEYKGRVGLHSLPQSERFYQEKCGMYDLGVDTSYEDLRYFEYTPALAESFLNKTGDKR